MRAFEAYVNTRKLCTAGVGDNGVLTAIVANVEGPRGKDLSLDVSGLFCATGEHVNWKLIRLRIGDEVRVKVIDADAVDKPRKRYVPDPAKELAAKKDYVRRLARELGWSVSARKPGSKLRY